jgi:hypothetical protein
LQSNSLGDKSGRYADHNQEHSTKGQAMENDIPERLLKTNAELIKCAKWLIEENDQEAAAKIMPITQAFARLLSETASERFLIHERRNKIAVVKKSSRK